MDSKNLSQLSKSVNKLLETSKSLSEDAASLGEKISNLASDATSDATSQVIQGGVDPFIFAVTIFVLSCFVGYYVIWKVTPALHTPLMSVTNAISGIIIVGAMISSGPEEFGMSKLIGFIAVTIASINIFGGFVVTHRMLSMFRKN